MNAIAETSPRFTARMAGLLYVVTIVARIVADGFVRDRLVIASDAAATSNNILAHATLFRVGFAADVIAFAAYVALTALLYQLFKPVNRNVSLIAALFSLVAAIVQAMSAVFHLTALWAAGAGEYLRGMSPEQVQSLALTLLRIRAIAYHNVGLVFFGFYCFLIGYLVVRSTFIPRTVGVLMALAGIAYWPFLWPPLAKSLLPYLLIPAGIGQIVFALWLAIVGLNAPSHRALTAAAAV